MCVCFALGYTSSSFWFFVHLCVRVCVSDCPQAYNVISESASPFVNRISGLTSASETRNLQPPSQGASLKWCLFVAVSVKPNSVDLHH